MARIEPRREIRGELPALLTPAELAGALGVSQAALGGAHQAEAVETLRTMVGPRPREAIGER